MKKRGRCSREGAVGPGTGEGLALDEQQLASPGLEGRRRLGGADEGLDVLTLPRGRGGSMP